MSDDIQNTKPMEDRIYLWLAGKGEQPIYLDQPDVPMPDGFYVCMDCKSVTDYWKPGMVCAKCEARGERQMEQERGN